MIDPNIVTILLTMLVMAAALISNLDTLTKATVINKTINKR